MINPKLALRSLFRTPVVTTVAILSLALGIGVNSAIFTMFESMILRPLPVEEPGRLVNLLDLGPKSGSVSANNAGGSRHVFSYPMFRDLEAADSDFSGVAAHCSFGANLSYEGNTVGGQGMLVSGSYFEVLGLRPALGRLFSKEDDINPDGHPLVVLSHRYWTQRFNAEPTILNQPLSVNGQAMTIIGVAPRGFSGTTLGNDPEVFVPLTMREAMVPGWEVFEERRSYWAYLFARLAPGATLEGATAAINGTYQNIIRDVELPLQEGGSEQYLQRFEDKALTLEPGQKGQSSMHAEVRTPLLMLLGVTGLVLLIACVNIANLLLIRASDRSGEIAVRLSIGARRDHIIKQLLTESFLLAAMGSALGLLVARGTLKLLLSLIPSDGGPAFDISFGPMTWLFIAILTFITGCVGLFPALHSTRRGLVELLKNQGGKASASRAANRFRAATVTLQIALAMALLVSAGLFTQSLVNVSKVDLGIRTEQLATFGISPERNGYTPEQSLAFFQRAEEHLTALPGVDRAVASLVPLISGSNWGTNVTVQGHDAGPDDDTNASYNSVGPGFFGTLGIPLISGREFEDRDALGAPQVAIVNEAFANKFSLGRNAVGQWMQVGSGGENDIEIIGLVQNAKYSEVKDEAPAVFYLPYRQDDNLGYINFYVRSSTPPAELMPILRKAVTELDPNLPVANLQTMAAQVQDNIVLDRILSTLSAAFATLATILAAIGLYGVMAYSVSQRRREIGLRMALGADAAEVRAMVLRQVGRLTMIGAILGLAGALGLGRLASSLLYDLEGHDPFVLLLSTILLACITLAAGFAPAQRATRIEPMIALRDE